MRNGYGGEEVFLFDPDEYNKEEGKQYTIGGISPNKDASLLAFSVAANGSESSVILIMDMKERKLLSEELFPCRGFAWLKDQKSLVYGKYNSDDITDENRKLNTKNYLHSVGTESESDQEVFHAPDYPELSITISRVISLISI